MRRDVQARHRYPWTEREERLLIRAKREGVSHKAIARRLKRTPRSVDQHVARMREYGRLAQYRSEELDLLKRLEREALLPSDLA
jgi:transposase